MKIILARLVEDFKVISTEGRDLGRSPKIEKFFRPVALTWKNDASEEDLAKANTYAKQEGYQVFQYSDEEKDPLERAKKDCSQECL